VLFHEQLHLIQTQDPSGKANYYFGMEMEAAFVQTPSGLDAWGHDIIFEFTGDDDFWLYVDGQLVLDLGGVHSAQMGTINFRTGDVYFDRNGTSVHSENMEHTTLRQIFYDNYKSKYPTATDEEVNEYLSEYFDGNIFKDYSTHTMKMFYMERGANASNLHMRFNIASVTPGHVVVSKSVSGEGTDALDSDFLEYPFQIYYTLPEGPNGEPGEEHLLGNNDEYVAVTYQNSNQPVNFVRKYRPPGFSEDQAYDNIYFINPSKNAEIAFPDNTITYRIVECAVNSTVYGNVTINGENVPDDRIEIRGDLKSYSSESGSAQVRPNISFDNHVNNNVIKDLLVTKKLLDEDNQEVTDDPATFNFRLSISSVKVSPDQIPLANMYSYLVLSPDKKICRFDPDTASFAETSVVYTRAHYKAIQDGQVPGVSTEDVTFKTSGFGSIAGIPAGYTICVPGLPVGSVFKVTEDPKTGYGLMGYERVMGSKTHEDGTVEPIASYMVDAGNPENIGTVIADENPQMEVHNRKGYGISAKKSWSDLSITTGHSEIYTAVYVDGTLLEGSVKQIKSPSTTANYFWTRLQPNSNGTERTSLDGYVIKEVTISNQNPTVLDDGTVTDSGTVTPISSGGRVNVVASRIDDVTPEGEDNDRAYDYIVTYGQKELSETSREDTITNTREGGIAIRLFRWDSDTPLPNGQFKLVDSSGNTVGNYYSDENGLVTILYDFEKNKTYTLTETAAPRGYVGLQKNLCFKVNNDGTVSLFYEDGTEWGTKDSVDLKWANGKLGDNGLSAYVDVYNKQFNFKVVKMDSEETGIVLDNAHFALYKQTNTAIGGYEKNRDPLTGFEDMVTSNGELYICGGNSGRTLNPGSRGSVYFLTETQAPLNYTKLDEDIVFRISAIGVPSLISDSYNGQLIETEDSYIYTLSVPNEKEAPGSKLLTVKKIVSGSAGDYSREFTFTLTVDSAEPTDGFEWMKNTVTQNTQLHSGDTFTLKHGDEVVIAVPAEVDLTVSEQNQEYTASFKLDDGQSQAVNTMTFSITDDATLEVTNTLGMVVPTGVMNYIIIPTLSLIIIFSITAAVILWRVKLCPHKKE
jgi:fibro-slime domain-containing protein